MILAHHLVLTGYGHWLSNDLRGSGSTETRKPELDDLGPVHFGRKPRHEQPSRDELRAFYREAEELLEHPTVWFSAAMRDALATAFGEVVRSRGYTCWACAICSNHGHLCIRVHRDDAVAIWDAFANAGRLALVQFPEFGAGHPVWSSRPYKVFLNSASDVDGRVDYIRKNPMKEGLPEQHHRFVVRFDGWAAHRRRARPAR
jgi:REP element-mobilizing transposase RayT